MSVVYLRFAAHQPFIAERAPLLEHWLARADCAASAADWRAQAFQLIAAPTQGMPPIATAALRAARCHAHGAWVCIATPVHLLAGPSGVSMPPDGILNLDPADADALAEDFNRVFSGAGMRLHRGLGSLLLCSFDAPLRVAAASPEEVHGDIWEFLPHAADAARVRRLMSEIEMWLFEHAVNERRRARAAPAITGLWLWGAGAADLPLPAVHGWTAGCDPLFAAFDARAQYASGAGSGVVVLADWPGTPAWREAERCWLAPAIADLRSGRLQRLDLSAGRRCFSVSVRGRWRFWRRTQPWWEAFGMGRVTDGDAD